jgi:hypothetical protein
MILRRLTEHVKTQNWFAIGLEFLILVVGVFFGLQVNNWNEERTNSHREAAYLVALQEDFSAIIKELESDIARYEQIANSMTMLLEQSRKASPDVSLVELNLAATQLTAMEGTPIVSDTYANLTGSGDLAIIKSQAIKNAMSAFFGQAEVIKLVGDTHEMQLVSIFQPYIIKNLDYPGMLSDDSGMLAIAAFEPERILTALPTAEFRNVVSVKWEITIDLRDQLLNAVDKARAVEALLAAEVEGSQ